ncbi:MAG: hypothetical protein H7343_14760 [Undibacterium sp.]|nr:hypothetical protein [Opitutaceae bacterium]
MKSLLSLPTLLAAALLSVVVLIPFLPLAAPKNALFHFEVTATSSSDGLAQLFFDIGRGINEADSSRANLVAGRATQKLSFDLPAGNYRSFRFDPIDREATLTFRDAVIRSPDGRIVRRFKPSEVQSQQQIATLSALGEQLEVVTTPRAFDPILSIPLATPIALLPSIGEDIRFIAVRFVPIFAALLGLVGLIHRSLDRVRQSWNWLAIRPARAVALCALLAVAASSYPVIFLGKSIVSPNNGTILLYEDQLTLPGYRERAVANTAGADIGAIMWAHIPLSMLEHDALLRDHEMPLWNRYNSAGTVLLGQGQSMFGDPLHFFVIVADGAAWAWDIKYIAAKWLLACGLGLCVLLVTRHLPAALLVAFAADFVGFFPFRVNHPAVFSFCYAPWVLYCWLRIATAPRWTGAARWSAGLLLANWTLMNSGTVKEAYMLLLTLNSAGACALLFASISSRERLLRFGLAGWAGVIFVSLSAPIWVTFLDALKASYTGYNVVTAFQVQPSLVLGFFDEILLRPFWVNETVYNPSANFLLLTGVLAFLVYLRVVIENRIALGLALAALMPLSIVFGLIPPLWIIKVPFLGNVAHIDNSFGTGLIQIVIVLAGIGFATASTRLARPEGETDIGFATLLLFGLVFPYVAFGQTVQRSTFSYLHWGESIPYSPFVWGSLAALIAAALGFMLVMRRLLTHGPSAHLLLFASTCVIIMLWRHGWHSGTGFEGRVVTPMVRVDFHGESPAITALRADQKGEPSRAVGFQGNLFPGWNDVYRLEGLNGPDALINPHYRELIEACAFVRIWDWRLYQEFATFAPLRPFYDFLNVRHYLDYKSNQGLLGAQLSPVLMADLDVYRSETAWPRAFFTDRLATYETPKEFAKQIATGDGRPFAAMQASDPARRPDLPTTLAPRTVTSARNYRLTANTTAFDIDANGPGVAVLTEAWLARDFRVTLDGERVSYLRVNHAFKGVAIPTAGRHHLEFTYRPRRFSLALSLFGLGLVLLGATTWGVRRLEKRNSQLPVSPANVSR